MLNVLNTGRGPLSALASRATNALHGLRRRRADRVVLGRLIAEDEHFLNDIGLTRSDIAAILDGGTVRR